jgi:hypothetical protein
MLYNIFPQEESWTFIQSNGEGYITTPTLFLAFARSPFFWSSVQYREIRNPLQDAASPSIWLITVSSFPEEYFKPVRLEQGRLDLALLTLSNVAGGWIEDVNGFGERIWRIDLRFNEFVSHGIVVEVQAERVVCRRPFERGVSWNTPGYEFPRL